MTDKTLTREQIISSLRIHADRVSEEGYHTRAIYMHAAADMLEEPAPASNNRLKRTLEFDVADGPMLMAAVRLAACTAMMCSHRDAEKKLRVYQQMFAQHVPAAAARFDEETWAEIGMALMAATSFHVTILPKRWERDRSWWREGALAVTIDGATFLGDHGVSPYVKRGDDAPPQALCEALQELAPMDCQGSWDSAKEPA